jgi:hypothetical protein
MAIVGDALVPLLQGTIANRIGIHHAFFRAGDLLLYILFYALSGSKPTDLPVRHVWPNPALVQTHPAGDVQTKSCKAHGNSTRTAPNIESEQKACGLWEKVLQVGQREVEVQSALRCLKISGILRCAVRNRSE